MRRSWIVVAIAAVALVCAGVASAYALRTIFIRPGHCTKVHGTKVCARSVKPRTSTVTVTVGPSPVGQTFSGNGDKTLAPVTLTHGVTVSWTSQPDADGFNEFEVSSSANDDGFVEFDNGNGTTSGTTFVPPGTYTLEVSASAAWTISF